jgi:hypothetical protein
MAISISTIFVQQGIVFLVATRWKRYLRNGKREVIEQKMKREVFGRCYRSEVHMDLLLLKANV